MAFPPAHPALTRALVERDYNDPTPVQTAVLEGASAGRDLLVSARTGSGKTAAFGLAIAATLMGEADRLPAASEPLALIIAPTRELALQVQRELEWLYKYAGARVISCVGGMDPRRERRLLAEGAHIVVGTPGRLRDHLQRGGLDVSALKAVVLDEADEMLDLGFREDLEFILETTPDTRRTLLFSATLPRDIVAMAGRFQNNALRIEASGGERGGHADIEYRAIRIAPRETEHAVVNVLRFFEAPTAIVFCATRDAVRHLHALLQERGFSAVALSGELSQSERSHALQALRDGRARVCVATDVAARGIDLPSLGLVIHADLPQNAEILQHRSGRTGRAGRKGISVLLVPPARRRRAEQMLSIAGVQTAWASAPTADEIRKLDQERLLQDPLLSGESGEDDMAMAQALLAERSPEDIASALVRIYRSRLPAAEEVTDPGDAGRGPREREPRADGGARAAAFGESVWFRLALGRKKNADPKWLLPMLCRRGGITKQDIGAIRIFENETKFQVSLAAAESFAAATRKADGDNIAIVRVTEGGGTERYDPVAASARAPMRKPRTAERHQPAEAPAPRREERPAVAERPARSDKPRHMGRPDRSERPAQGERSAPPAARPWGERPGKARDDRPRPAEAAKPKGKPKARDKDKGKPKWDKRPRS